ncbi:ATP-binding cassette domain-containing protein [Mucilaginibacter sp. E4BP6]|uniref:ABC transporter ATP-binding protein n=1 Tax=Mucilaginibacter sp. E4BP6 TaxID=2723089 RepID=UPI0015C73E2D|nr:ABC transporter ATP-binding protein [Mucilaginibacter sp. E4BP6]NYE68012.1 ABC-2 type transport system ATP-binding protein [Mucilaginibacter sp. E4BP6]
MIQINNLSKSYGRKLILNDISLQFEPGNIYGIIGENGAGKTTQFRCMTGLEKFEGNIVSDYDILKNNIGMLQTEPYFLNRITGREYIQLFINARGKSIVDLSDKNILDLPLDQYITTYSTGMKKKIALMAILLQQNTCYILDEPFNGVDLQSNLVILEIIKTLKKLNKIVIISSHIFNTLNELCDQICLLRDGKVIKKVGKETFHEIEQEISESFTVTEKVKKLMLI